MTLICIQGFGNFRPGDQITVPDGAVYDSAFFEEAPAPPQSTGKTAAKHAREGD